MIMMPSPSVFLCQHVMTQLPARHLRCHAWYLDVVECSSANVWREWCVSGEALARLSKVNLY